MKPPETFARHQAVGAYQRWHPPAFDTPPAPQPAPQATPPAGAKAETKPGTGAAPSRPSPPGSASSPSLPPGLHLPTVDEIEQMHAEARRSGHEEGFAEGHKGGFAEGRDKGYAEGQQVGYDSGYAAGLDEGREKGREEGRAEGRTEGKAAADEEARRLHGLFVQLDGALSRLDAEIAEEMLALATELARKVLQHTLAVEPEVVVNTIRSALQFLPQRRTQISLHPDDIALAREHLDEVLEQGGHLLIEDDSVSRGGCKVEASGAQIDATMETRWRKVLESLGRTHAPWTGEPAAKPKRVASDEKPADEKPVVPPDETGRVTSDEKPVAPTDETGNGRAVSPKPPDLPETDPGGFGETALPEPIQALPESPQESAESAESAEPDDPEHPE